MTGGKPIITKSATTPLPTTTTTTLVNMEYRSISILDDDWNNSQQLILGTPSSASSSLFEICRCCSRQNCENLEYYNRTMKKLESDTRLAAGSKFDLLKIISNTLTKYNRNRSRFTS